MKQYCDHCWNHSLKIKYLRLTNRLENPIVGKNFVCSCVLSKIEEKLLRRLVDRFRKGYYHPDDIHLVGEEYDLRLAELIMPLRYKFDLACNNRYFDILKPFNKIDYLIDIFKLQDDYKSDIQISDDEQSV